MNGFTAPELHYPLAMNSIVTLDNLWMGRPRSIAAALLESDGHRAVIDPGPGSTLQTLFGETLPVPAENLRILEGSETLNLGARKLEVVYTPGHASHHVSYFDNIEGIAFVGDTTGIRIEGQAYVMPATPPPDIDLGIWDSSFAALLARKPSRLFLTHFGFSDNPSEHVRLFRERLHRWAALTAEILRIAANDSAAMDSFMSATYAEISQHLPAGEADHYAFSAGLNLSFLGLARYLRKRATAAS